MWNFQRNFQQQLHRLKDMMNGMWNVVSPSQLPKNTVTSLLTRQMEKSPNDKFWDSAENRRNTLLVHMYKLFYIRLFRTGYTVILQLERFSRLVNPWDLVQVGSSWSVMAHLSSFLILGINAARWLLSNRWSWAVSQGRTLMFFYLASVVSMYEKPGSTCDPTLDVANTLNSSDKTKDA